MLVGSSDEHLRALLRRLLAHDGGFDVVDEASDGDAVVGCPQTFDLALVDMSIAGLGIIGVLAQLGRRTPAPTVVVITHYDAGYLRAALAAEGASDYVVVPEDLGDLGERLVRAAARARHLAATR